MVAMRIVALSSNLALIAYGAGVGAEPVLVLHLELLLMNARRLLDALQTGQQVQGAAMVASPISASQNTDADHVPFSDSLDRRAA
jgi:CRP/FNR family transcriptional regulator, cyclic AMP receptor protein